MSALKKPFVTGLICTLLSLAIHLAPPLNSQLTMEGAVWHSAGQLLSEDYLEQNIAIHRSIEPAFVKRPLTTWIIDTVTLTGASPGLAFVLVGFLFFLLAGISLRRFAVRMGMEDADAWRAQVFFHLLPTVLFAFFPPMYTYDEPLQYILLFLALAEFANRRRLLFMFWFSLAMLARETSAILLPSLAWMVLSGPLGPSSLAARIKGLLTLAVPVMVYAIFLGAFLPWAGLTGQMQHDVGGRLSFFDHNFRDGEMAGESLCFLFLAIGLPLFLLARYVLSPDCPPAHKRWIESSLIALVLNTAVVLMATKAREARLFTLPLLLVLPMIGAAWSKEMERHHGIRGLLAPLKRWPYAISFLYAGGLVVLVSDHVFQLSDGVGSANLFHEYFVVQSLFMCACLLSDAARRRPVPVS